MRRSSLNRSKGSKVNEDSYRSNELDVIAQFSITKLREIQIACLLKNINSNHIALSVVILPLRNILKIGIYRQSSATVVMKIYDQFCIIL